VWVF
jgi:hypothetical protein